MRFSERPFELSSWIFCHLLSLTLPLFSLSAVFFLDQFRLNESICGNFQKSTAIQFAKKHSNSSSILVKLVKLLNAPRIQTSWNWKLIKLISLLRNDNGPSRNYSLTRTVKLTENDSIIVSLQSTVRSFDTTSRVHQLKSNREYRQRKEHRFEYCQRKPQKLESEKKQQKRK